MDDLLLQDDLALQPSSPDVTFRLRPEEGGGKVVVAVRDGESERSLIAMERITRELRAQINLRPGDVTIDLRPRLYLAFLAKVARGPDGTVLLVPEVPFYGIMVRSAEWPIYSG